MKQTPTTPFYNEGWILSMQTNGRYKVEKIDDVEDYMEVLALLYPEWQPVEIPQLESDKEAYELAKRRGISFMSNGMVLKDGYLLNYDTKILKLRFRGEWFTFSLDDGNVGDFWNSFTDAQGVQWDINFYQEDEEEKPSVAVYGLTKQPTDDDSEFCFVVDTSDEHVIEVGTTEGSPEAYFGISVQLDKPLPEDAKMYILMHDHAHGNTVSYIKTMKDIGGYLNDENEPTELQTELLAILNLNYEPSKGDSIIIDLVKKKDVVIF